MIASPEKKLELANAMVRYSTSRLQALEQARRLIGHFPHARPPDIGTYADGLADIFENYPIGVVEECCHVYRGIANSKDYLPAPAAVIAWCDRRLGACQNIIRRGVPPSEMHYSEEHCATMRGRLQDLMRSLFGRIPPPKPDDKARAALASEIGEAAFNALPEREKAA